MIACLLAPAQGGSATVAITGVESDGKPRTSRARGIAAGLASACAQFGRSAAKDPDAPGRTLVSWGAGAAACGNGDGRRRVLAEIGEFRERAKQ